jgi:hypothetical protein
MILKSSSRRKEIEPDINPGDLVRGNSHSPLFHSKKAIVVKLFKVGKAWFATIEIGQEEHDILAYKLDVISRAVHVNNMDAWNEFKMNTIDPFESEVSKEYELDSDLPF